MPECEKPSGVRLFADQQISWLGTHLHLPDQVLDFLRAKREIRRRPGHLNGTWIDILCLLVGMFFATALSNIIVMLEVALGLSPSDLVMRQWLFSPSMITGVCFGIAAAALVGSLFKRTQFGPVNNISMELAGLTTSNSKYRKKLYKWFYKGLSKGIDRTTSAPVFLKELERKFVNRRARRAFIFGVVFFPTVLFDVRSATWVTADGVIRSPYFSAQIIKLNWSDADLVEVGCRTGSPQSLIRNRILYRIRFSDGSIVDLGKMNAVRRSQIDALAVVDNALRQQYVPVNFGVKDPRCLAAKRSRLGPEAFARLERILHNNDRIYFGGGSKILPGDIRRICRRFKAVMTYQECVDKMSRR